MKLEEIIYIASVAIVKRWDYETLYNSDHMYGKERYADEVWDYVEECEDYGRIAFYSKYKDYKLYY